VKTPPKPRKPERRVQWLYNYCAGDLPGFALYAIELLRDLRTAAPTPEAMRVREVRADDFLARSYIPEQQS
jgi:hypothetical protein